MKKTSLIIICLITCLSMSAQDKKLTISNAIASNYHNEDHAASKAIDGDINTLWHSNWSNIPEFPLTFTITFGKVEHVNYVRYIPRQDNNENGRWKKVTVAYCPTTDGKDFVEVGDYDLGGSSNPYAFYLGEEGVTCGQIRFTIYPGASNVEKNLASAAEIEAYAYDTEKIAAFAQYLTGDVYSQLKPGVTSSEGIKDADVKALVDAMLADAEGYKKFRVGEYEPYMTTATVRNNLKTNALYNNYENPTGIYLKRGESCIVAVSGIDGKYPVDLKIKDWYKSGDLSSYSLRNGLNYITAITEGNVFVDYYTDDFEQAPNVQMHFINAPVLGYWDQATMTNADWVSMLAGPLTKDDEVIIITRSEHAQTAYPVKQWKTYCPANVDSTMTLYQQVQWAERDILGLEKYGRQVKNRQLFYADKSGSMYAGGDASVCGYGDLRVLVTPDAATFDFWGVGHEWGHNNQMPGFHWSGCGETTNNIPASWAQIHFTGNRDSQGKVTNLRLEDENTGVNDYSGTRGGRMQTYFEEGLRKGVAWQLQDGPDYHGATPVTKTVMGIDADGKSVGVVTTTSRNYDHFVKLVPFWQLNLWGTLAGKCPDIIPMVIESIRTTPDYGATYNTNGKQQINWMKLACDSAKIDLLPFFEKAGMLRPINAYIEDYGAGWNIISEEMIAALKAYVKEKGYPAYSEEINYINGHNYHIYRDNLKLETPERIGEGCKLSGNKVTVQHSAVKNAVAFETYNAAGQLLRITMYGLGSDNAHSFTQVLYPSSNVVRENARYIMAVGYDGTRRKIYGHEGTLEDLNLEGLREMQKKAKTYLDCKDETGTKVGYFFPSYLVELSTLVEKVDNVIQNKDTTEYNYTEWFCQLDTTVTALLNNSKARVPMSSLGYYSIAVRNTPLYSIAYDAAGLRTKANDPATSLTSQWEFVASSQPNIYYLRNRGTLNFITLVQNGSRVKAESNNITDAVPFKLINGEPGELLIQHANNANINLYNATSNYVSGGTPSASAWWILTMVDRMPEIGVNGKCVLYRIQCIDNGQYLNNYTGRFNKGRLITGMYGNADDNNYWFYFVKGKEAGKYRIYNHATMLPVTYSDGYHYVSKETDAPLEFSITDSEERNGLVITGAEGAWNLTTGGYIGANSTEKSLFLLHKVGEVSDIEELYTPSLNNGVYYDLMGRPVKNPTSGIYIYNGKKVLK